MMNMESIVNFIRHNFYLKALLAWGIWMVVGTVYYSIANELGWAKGFYMAVNVGYSIGWGYPVEINESARLFSTFYVLVGASAVAASLSYFAQHLLKSSKEWYNDALVSEDVRDKLFLYRCQVWIQTNDTLVKAIALWLVWIGCMIAFSCERVGWSFIDGLYFAVSSLSTGGLFAIPSDSPDWYFGVVGVFSATGIPIMAIAMGQVASLLVTKVDPEELHALITARVTREELEMMKQFQIDNGDGKIDRSEFVLLCVVRMGALSPEFIQTIYKRFDELDKDGSGALDYHEILEMKVDRRNADAAATIAAFLQRQKDMENNKNNNSSVGIITRKRGAALMTAMFGGSTVSPAAAGSHGSSHDDDLDKGLLSSPPPASNNSNNSSSSEVADDGQVLPF